MRARQSTSDEGPGVAAERPLAESRHEMKASAPDVVDALAVERRALGLARGWGGAPAMEVSPGEVEVIERSGTPARVAPFSHVIFDLDGVLLDTEPLLEEALRRLIEPFGARCDPSLREALLGLTPLDTARHVTSALRLPLDPESFLERRRALLGPLLAAAEPVPGAEALTRALSQRGIPMAVATSCDREGFLLRTQRHAGWFSVFRTVVCSDHPRVRRGKPAPYLFLVAAQEMAAEPASCLVVEDAPAGVDAAIAAGMQVLALTDGRVDPARYARAHHRSHGHDECARILLGAR